MEGAEVRFVTFERPVSGHDTAAPHSPARLADAVETSIRVCETQPAGTVRGEEAVRRVGTTVAFFEETKYMCALFLLLGSLQYHQVLPVAGQAASAPAAISRPRQSTPFDNGVTLLRLFRVLFSWLLPGSSSHMRYCMPLLIMWR